MNYKKYINKSAITLWTLWALNFWLISTSNSGNKTDKIVENKKEQIISKLDEEKTLNNKIIIALREEAFFYFKKIEINWKKIDEKYAWELADWLIKEIIETDIINDILPKSKPVWISILFALIYTALYTQTIKKILKDHHTVSTLSFWWFSSINLLFAIQNWVLDPWSLWYLSAHIMWAITVAINEREKNRINKWIVKPSIPDEYKKDLLIQEILKEFVIWEKNPVVIYTKIKDWEDFPYETPLFWNPAMEKITWYKFDEVKNKTQKEIIELQYWYDENELLRAMNHLQRLDQTWIWYKNVVFTMKSKNWEKHQIAWHSEKIKSWWRISFGSIDQAEVQKILRNDVKFDCLNEKSLNEDFESIIKINWVKEDLPTSNKILSLIYCDLDNFKWINDKFWHIAWDAVLSEFIDFIKKELRRKDDNLYRIGWDEFVILCNFTDKNTIQKRIEKLQKDFFRKTVTISIDWENVQVSSKTHWDHLAAKAYFNANNYNSSTILWELNKKEESKKIKWKKIVVLPPVWTSWWIIDYNYWNINENDDLKSILNNLKDQADKLMYLSKNNWKNWVH